jgi:cobyrinic acid a,c-diamide synthase
MILGEGLEDANGKRHRMAGLLSHSTTFARRRLTLGYRRGYLRASSPLGTAGACIYGHEFRYSVVLDEGRDEPLLDLFDARGSALGPAGGRRGQVTGAYFHAIAGE